MFSYRDNPALLHSYLPSIHLGLLHCGIHSSLLLCLLQWVFGRKISPGASNRRPKTAPRVLLHGLPTGNDRQAASLLGGGWWGGRGDGGRGMEWVHLALHWNH